MDNTTCQLVNRGLRFTYLSGTLEVIMTLEIHEFLTRAIEKLDIGGRTWDEN